MTTNIRDNSPNCYVVIFVVLNTRVLCVLSSGELCQVSSSSSIVTEWSSVDLGLDIQLGWVAGQPLAVALTDSQNFHGSLI